RASSVPSASRSTSSAVSAGARSGGIPSRRRNTGRTGPAPLTCQSGCQRVTVTGAESGDSPAGVAARATNRLAPTANGTCADHVPSAAVSTVAKAMLSRHTVTCDGQSAVPLTVTVSSTVTGASTTRVGAPGAVNSTDPAQRIASTSSCPAASVQPRPGPTSAVTALADSSSSTLPAVRQSYPTASPVTGSASVRETCSSASGTPA